jgi:hypothetical protein
MPNLIAYLALFTWPVVAIILFRLLPLHKALVWTIIGGYLLLPSATAIKFPMLPPIDKSLVTSVPALILCLIMAPAQAPTPDPMARSGRLVLVVLLGLVLVSPFLTVLQNTEPVIEGHTFLPGLRLYDAWGIISVALVSMIPLWLGLRYLNTAEGQRAILEGLALGGLAYTIPVLFEVRFSPQLHTWVYGFFQHNFAQHIRDGGFRPIVFLSHGLLVGIFLCISAIAAITLYREARREGKPAVYWLLSAVWLIGVLFLSKNAGAFMTAIALATAVFLLGRRPQLILALCIAAIVMLYPILRGAGLVPVQSTVEFVQSINAERADSLRFRLENEDELLARANLKPLAGWGTWGRNLIHDPNTGELTSTIDGIWVALIGMFGWIGYIGRFGLLTVPILLHALRRNTVGPSLIPIGLILTLCATLIDLLPNSGLVNYVWLMAGSVAGHVVWQRTGQPDSVAATFGDGARPAFGKARPVGWLMQEAGPAPREPKGELKTRRTRR